jgi:chromosome segregation ATPase
MELNATITIEETTLTGMIETAVSDVLESQKGEIEDTYKFDSRLDDVEGRVDELENQETWTTEDDHNDLVARVDDHDTYLESTVDRITFDKLGEKVEANHTEAIDTLNSHGEVLRSLNLAIDQVRHNNPFYDGKVDELAENQETAEEQIAMLNRRVDTLVRCVSAFRTGLLMTTGHPNFLVDLDADTTPPLNARFEADDKVADELVSMIDEVTNDLRPDLDGGSDTH